MKKKDFEVPIGNVATLPSGLYGFECLIDGDRCAPAALLICDGSGERHCYILQDEHDGTPPDEYVDSPLPLGFLYSWHVEIHPDMEVGDSFEDEEVTGMRLLCPVCPGIGLEKGKK